MVGRERMFVRALAAAGTAGALATCAQSTPGTDASSDVEPDVVALADAPPRVCTPRPADFSPCARVGEECIVPPDPTPPDVMPLPSGGSCRCEANAGGGQWRCYLAAGPLVSPELV